MTYFRDIRAIIYDLDGTIIDTTSLHEEGWIHAGNSFGVEITKQMLINQGGLTGLNAARMMLGDDASSEDIKIFADVKRAYVKDKFGECIMFPGFLETYKQLLERDMAIWICTSASRVLVNSVLSHHKGLEPFRDKIVSQEMYTKGKPSAEPILKTLELMGGLAPRQGIYVGDAFSDYDSARNAKPGFVYFCPVGSEVEERIPNSTPKINNHSGLLGHFS